MQTAQDRGDAFTEWTAREAIAFDVEAADSLDAAIDRFSARLGPSVALLGFGEALHGGEEILVLRNRLFQRLVQAHGYTAMAIESSFPRARLVDDYIAGRGPSDYHDLIDRGFGHTVGQLEANRELVEWMRAYNADQAHPVKLRFDGFDIPTGAQGIASPRQVLEFALGYLASIDGGRADSRRTRVAALLGQDQSWENPAVYLDPSRSIGLSSEAAALRIETEDLIAELRTRSPELMAASGSQPHAEALHHGVVARELLNFHAALASRRPGESPARVLGVRDALMADTLAYITQREAGRGKVLAFAQNSHLQRGKATWPGQKYWGTDDPCEWWPAGAHLQTMLGPRYAVIGSAVGSSEANGIGAPESGTLEARLTALPGPARFIPLPRHGHRVGEVGPFPARSGSSKNPTYTPLSGQSLSDFDALAVLDQVTYHRGGPSLTAWG
jgi:erythromycin esterase